MLINYTCLLQPYLPFKVQSTSTPWIAPGRVNGSVFSFCDLKIFHSLIYEIYVLAKVHMPISPTRMQMRCFIYISVLDEASVV